MLHQSRGAGLYLIKVQVSYLITISKYLHHLINRAVNLSDTI